MLNFRRRVLVLASENDRIVFTLQREQASQYVAKGQAVPEGRKEGAISSIRLTLLPCAELESARAGSFGVRRDRVSPGITGHAGLVFSHKRTWQRELSA